MSSPCRSCSPSAASRSSAWSAAARSRITGPASSWPIRSSPSRPRAGRRRPQRAQARGRGAPLGVRPFVEALEGAMADTCAAAGVAPGRGPVIPAAGLGPRGRCRARSAPSGSASRAASASTGSPSTSTTNLADFDLIDPCGMPGLRSTSIARERARAGLPGADATRRRPRDSVARAAAAASRRPSPDAWASSSSATCRPRPRPLHDRRAGGPRRPTRRREPAASRDPPMAAGLFELRRDAITGWWVATLVDREFERERFMTQRRAGRRPRRLLQLPDPAGRGRPHADPQGLRVPHRRHRGRGSRARAKRRPDRPVARPGRPGAGGRSSPRPASTGPSTRSGSG